MSGRNSKPKNNGPASHPSRIEQYRDKLRKDNDLEQGRISHPQTSNCDRS